MLLFVMTMHNGGCSGIVGQLCLCDFKKRAHVYRPFRFFGTICILAHATLQAALVELCDLGVFLYNSPRKTMLFQ